MTNSESDPDSPLNLSMEKMDSIMLGKDMDNEVFTTCTAGLNTSTTTTKTESTPHAHHNSIASTTTPPMSAASSTTTANHSHIVIKQEPIEPDTHMSSTVS